MNFDEVTSRAELGCSLLIGDGNTLDAEAIFFLSGVIFSCNYFPEFSVLTFPELAFETTSALMNLSSSSSI